MKRVKEWNKRWNEWVPVSCKKCVFGHSEARCIKRQQGSKQVWVIKDQQQNGEAFMEARIVQEDKEKMEVNAANGMVDEVRTNNKSSRSSIGSIHSVKDFQ